MMADAPEFLMDPYEALRNIEVFVRVAEESDNPNALPVVLREVRAVLAKALPKKTRRRRKV